MMIRIIGMALLASLFLSSTSLKAHDETGPSQSPSIRGPVLNGPVLNGVNLNGMRMNGTTARDVREPAMPSHTAQVEADDTRWSAVPLSRASVKLPAADPASREKNIPVERNP